MDPDRGGSTAAGRPGARMPAEWEPHTATWLAWPHNASTWPGVHPRIPAVWAAMVRALRDGETVRILVRGADDEREVRRALAGDLGGVELCEIPTNDAWIRDYGPLFVHLPDGELAATCWIFNSWGEKYPPWDDDARVARTIAGRLGVPALEPALVLEGGSLDVDGQGTLLTTQDCLLAPTRNPDVSRTEIEAVLERFLGIRRVVWLQTHLEGDDTDGHIDNVARFVAPGRVVCAMEPDPRDPNHTPLSAMRAMLGEAVDASGRKLDVIDFPMPPPIVHDALRCPASYANFYIGNAAVLVPTFRSERDALALGVLGELFPGRKIVGIDSFDLVYGQGGLHCVSQQEPAVP